MPEKLVLQWNDFKDNVKTAFGNLRDDKYFTDVTLASEDGQQVEAHKMILAASSPFFQQVLERHKHPCPLLYMKGLKSEDLLAVVDFLYSGEANVEEDNLVSFLVIAEELQLKGLMGRVGENPQSTSVSKEESQSEMTKPILTSPIEKENKVLKKKIKTEAELKDSVAPSNNLSGDFAKLEEQVRSLMKKTDNNYGNGHQKTFACQLCGKESKGNAIKDHIEAKHLEGIVLPCNQCGKTFRCRNSLKRHIKEHSSHS